MAEITFIKFLFREDWAPLKEVVSAAGKDYGEIQEIDDEKALTKAMIEGQPTMILASVKSKEDVSKLLAYLKANRRVLKENSIKFTVVNFTNNRQVETALMKMGCQEVLDPSIKGKPLKYKLDMWKKTLTSQKQAVGGDGKMSIKEKGQDGNSAVQSSNDVKWEEPIKCVDDMWLIKKPEDAKKILGKWLVRFMGPSPFVGQWAEAVPGKKGIWKFAFKEEARNTFHNTPGTWFFLGDQKPEFIWKENVWMVTGSQMQLVFQNGEEKEARFQGTPAGLSVAKNSAQAKMLELLIIETFDQEVMMKKGLITETSTEVETDRNAGGHLKGKTDGEEAINTGPLEGKGATDDLGGNLEGNTEGGEGDQGGNYDGKSSTDKLDGEEDGNAGSDNIGPGKYKGKMKFDKNTRQSQYGGDADTDDLGPDHYSNQEGGVSHQKEKNHGLSKDPVRKGEMNGKFETEDLGPAHYSNAQDGGVSHRKTKEPGLERESAAGEAEPGDLDGHGKTDDLGASHYGGKKKRAGGSADADEEEAKEDANGVKSHQALVAEEKAAKKKRVEEAYAKAAEAEAERERAKHEEENARLNARRNKAKAEVEEIDRAAAAEKEKKERQFAETMAARKKEIAEAEAAAEDSNVVPILRDKAKRPDAPKINPVTGEADEIPGGDYADNLVTSTATVVALVRKKGELHPGTPSRVDDFFDSNVILCVPNPEFTVGDTIEVSMTFEYMKKTKKIEVSGKCSEANPDGEGGSYLTVILGEYEAKLFEQFMQLYQLRQKHVEEFMKQAKGL